MITKFKLKYDKLEKNRIELFSQLENVNSSLLIKKPTKEKWSIIQILYHLLRSEQLSIISIKHTIAKEKNIKKSNILSYFRGLSLSLALSTSLKFKAPQNAAEIPDNGNLNELKIKWDKVRKNLLEIIETTDEKILKSDIFSHPIAGKMNLNAAINFMHSHFNHHKKQIIRLNSYSSKMSVKFL